MCVQSVSKVFMMKNENCWSYRLHKLATLKVLSTDGQTDERGDCLDMGKRVNLLSFANWRSFTDSNKLTCQHL
jgi:hypothetical protein